ncbi:hypothetical protein BTO04_07765 [Polaribacter sp. SA4-10]|nr:hypothetical protein BTO04_07765 [Polaribacter sp. SA4-10]
MKQKMFHILLLFSIFFHAQEKDTIILKNGIDKQSILTTHHFGIFSARINQNFKVRPPKRSTIELTIESGNNFHPFVEAYLPKDKLVRQQLSELAWYNRNFNFVDQQTTPAEYMNIVVDAVFKGFRVDFNTRIAKNHELGISLRTYLVTQGHYPFSVFSNDETLEWFHSNIAGGEDPYGRRYCGLNKVNVKYTDRNGRKMELKNGDFIFAGIELNHFYYPEFINKKNDDFKMNFGSHLGINTSKFNPSIDIGLSANAIKKWNIKDKYDVRLGLGISVLRKNFINFNDVVELGDNTFLGTLEPQIEFTKYTQKKNYHSFGVNYQRQTSYSNRKQADYTQYIGLYKKIHAGWQYGFQKLYEHLSAWTILYTYGRKNYKFSLYIKEDLYVNNAPDIQTGISLKIPLSK